MTTAATTTTSPRENAATAPRLSGNLGVADIIFMVMATSAPLTVIAGVYPVGFAYGNGAGFPAVYLGLGILLLLFAAGFTAMTRKIPNPGAFFTYIAHGLGRPLGLAGAYTALLCYVCIELAVVGFIGYDVSVTLSDAAGIHIHWIVFAAIAWLLIAYMGYRHIELSAKVLGVLLIIEMGISLLLSLVILAQGGAQGLDAHSFTWAGIIAGVPALSIMFAAASFIGFESTAIYRDEARHPEKTIPRATYGAVVLLGLFYSFTCWAFVMAWGSSHIAERAASDPSLLFSTTSAYLGVVGKGFIQVFLITSIFAVTLAFHNVIARYLHALSGVRALPGYLSRMGHDGGPSAASLTTSAGIGILVLITLVTGLKPYANTFVWFAGLGTMAYLIVLAACCVAVVVYFAANARRREGESFWAVIVCPLIAAIGLGYADYITIANFPLLVGDVDAQGNPEFGGLSAWLLALFIAVIVLGLVQAYVLRARNRRAYDGITESGSDL
ncbi:MAG: APC family permease [Salinisphaera sp.]|nr:APC family permease [Salinisphaera sp.]